MQPRYTLQQPLQKKDYLEYGRLLTHLSTRWAWCVLAILPLVFLALYVAALFDGENRPEFLLFGVACFAYWAFSGEIFGSSAFSGAVRTTGLPRGYAFYEDYVQAFTTTGDTKVAYSAVKKLAETDQIFLLSISRNNYLLIPKSALAPHDITPFRAFLEEKTGKAMLKYYLLAVPQMAAQMLLTNGVYRLLGISETAGGLRTLWYVIVMVCLYFISYTIQQRWVFVKQGAANSADGSQEQDKQ